MPRTAIVLTAATLLTAALIIDEASAATFTYTASEDAFIRGGAPNANDGSDTILRVRTNGPTRSLVRFDQAAGWKAVSKGFNYKDTTLSASGIKTLILRTGEDGKAKMIAKGQGPNLSLPPRPLAQDQTVIAQIKNDLNGGQCWETRFTGPAKKNDSVSFKDKGDAPLS